MILTGEVVKGAVKIVHGASEMGIKGEVLVTLTADDGEGLERTYRVPGQFKDLELADGVIVRTVTIMQIHFRWPKR
jgi:hypothetical protein